MTKDQIQLAFEQVKTFEQDIVALDRYLFTEMTDYDTVSKSGVVDSLINLHIAVNKIRSKITYDLLNKK